MSEGQPRVIVMGVSAVGKSTVGASLAASLGVPFVDGDDLHSPASIAKMSSGVALDDDDRGPWLRACGRALAEAPSGAVLACSALARRYRAVLAQECPDAFIVHLTADPDRILERARLRGGHFMPVTLLQSQLDTLESLDSAEGGVEIDAEQPVDEIVATALGALRGEHPPD